MSASLSFLGRDPGAGQETTSAPDPQAREGREGCAGGAGPGLSGTGPPPPSSWVLRQGGHRANEGTRSPLTRLKSDAGAPWHPAGAGCSSWPSNRGGQEAWDPRYRGAGYLKGSPPRKGTAYNARNIPAVLRLCLTAARGPQPPVHPGSPVGALGTDFVGCAREGSCAW